MACALNFGSQWGCRAAITLRWRRNQRRPIHRTTASVRTLFGTDRPHDGNIWSGKRVCTSESNFIGRNESLTEKDLKMKTFVVYDLDSKMPVAVGEQVTAETARYCASVATGIFHANLFAEEIDLEKKLPTSPESGTVASA